MEKFTELPYLGKYRERETRGGKEKQGKSVVFIVNTHTHTHSDSWRHFLNVIR